MERTREERAAYLRRGLELLNRARAGTLYESDITQDDIIALSYVKKGMQLSGEVDKRPAPPSPGTFRQPEAPRDNGLAHLVDEVDMWGREKGKQVAGWLSSHIAEPLQEFGAEVRSESPSLFGRDMTAIGAAKAILKPQLGGAATGISDSLQSTLKTVLENSGITAPLFSVLNMAGGTDMVRRILQNVASQHKDNPLGREAAFLLEKGGDNWAEAIAPKLKNWENADPVSRLLYGFGEITPKIAEAAFVSHGIGAGAEAAGLRGGRYISMERSGLQDMAKRILPRISAAAKGEEGYNWLSRQAARTLEGILHGAETGAKYSTVTQALGIDRAKNPQEFGEKLANDVIGFAAFEGAGRLVGGASLDAFAGKRVKAVNAIIAKAMEETPAEELTPGKRAEIAQDAVERSKYAKYGTKAEEVANFFDTIQEMIGRKERSSVIYATAQAALDTVKTAPGVSSAREAKLLEAYMRRYSPKDEGKLIVVDAYAYPERPDVAHQTYEIPITGRQGVDALDGKTLILRQPQFGVGKAIDWDAAGLADLPNALKVKIERAALGRRAYVQSAPEAPKPPAAPPTPAETPKAPATPTTQAQAGSQTPDRIALWSYHDKDVRRLVQGQKEANTAPSARQTLHEELKGAALAEIQRRGGLGAMFGPVDLVTDVPPYLGKSTRQRGEGWDMLGKLTQAIAQQDGNTYAEVLEKVRGTRKQRYLKQRSVAEQRANVEGAFAVAPEYRGKLQGKTVLLVDDNYGKGFTSGAAKQALEAEGAKVKILTMSTSNEGRGASGMAAFKKPSAETPTGTTYAEVLGKQGLTKEEYAVMREEALADKEAALEAAAEAQERIAAAEAGSVSLEVEPENYMAEPERIAATEKRKARKAKKPKPQEFPDDLEPDTYTDAEIRQYAGNEVADAIRELQKGASTPESGYVDIARIADGVVELYAELKRVGEGFKDNYDRSFALIFSGGADMRRGKLKGAWLPGADVWMQTFRPWRENISNLKKKGLTPEQIAQAKIDYNMDKAYNRAEAYFVDGVIGGGAKIGAQTANDMAQLHYAVDVRARQMREAGATRGEMRADAAKITNDASIIQCAMDAARLKAMYGPDYKIPENYAPLVDGRLGISIDAAGPREIFGAVEAFMSKPSAQGGANETAVGLWRQRLAQNAEKQAELARRGLLAGELANDPNYMMHVVKKYEEANIGQHTHRFAKKQGGSTEEAETDFYKVNEAFFRSANTLIHTYDYVKRMRGAFDILSPNSRAYELGTVPGSPAGPNNELLEAVAQARDRGLERMGYDKSTGKWDLPRSPIVGYHALTYKGVDYVYDVQGRGGAYDIGEINVKDPEAVLNGIARMLGEREVVNEEQARQLIMRDMERGANLAEMGIDVQADTPRLVIIPKEVYEHVRDLGVDSKLNKIAQGALMVKRLYWKRWALAVGSQAGYIFQNLGDQYLMAEVLGWYGVNKGPLRPSVQVAALRAALAQHGIALEDAPLGLGTFVRRTMENYEYWVQTAERQGILDPGSQILSEFDYGKRPGDPRDLFNPINAFYTLSNYAENAKRFGNYVETLHKIQSGKLVPEHQWNHRNLDGLAQEEAAATIVLMNTTDYRKLSQAQKEMRDALMPFITWSASQLHNTYSKLVTLTAKDSTPAQRFQVLKGAGTAAMPLLLAMVWNNINYPEIEKDLPDYMQAIPHLITGFRGKNGKPMVLAFPAPFASMMAAVGLNNATSIPQRWVASHIAAQREGKPQNAKTLGQIAREWWMTDAANGKALRYWTQQAEPGLKTIAGLIANRDPRSNKQIVPGGMAMDSSEATMRRWKFVAQSWFPAYSKYLSSVEEGVIENDYADFTSTDIQGMLEAFYTGWTNPRSLGFTEADLANHAMSVAAAESRQLDSRFGARMSQARRAIVRYQVNPSSGTAKEQARKLVTALLDDGVTLQRIDQMCSTPTFYQEIAKARYEAIPPEDVGRKAQARRLMDAMNKAAWAMNIKPREENMAAFVERMKKTFPDDDTRNALLEMIYAGQAATERIAAQALRDTGETAADWPAELDPYTEDVLNAE